MKSIVLFVVVALLFAATSLGVGVSTKGPPAVKVVQTQQEKVALLWDEFLSLQKLPTSDPKADAVRIAELKKTLTALYPKGSKILRQLDGTHAEAFDLDVEVWPQHATSEDTFDGWVSCGVIGGGCAYWCIGDPVTGVACHNTGSSCRGYIDVWDHVSHKTFRYVYERPCTNSYVINADPNGTGDLIAHYTSTWSLGEV